MNNFSHLEQHAKEAIDACASENASLAMTMEGFQTDEEALNLRDMLWYARSKGVDVIMAPGNQEEIIKDSEVHFKENF